MKNITNFLYVILFANCLLGSSLPAYGFEPGFYLFQRNPSEYAEIEQTLKSADITLICKSKNEYRLSSSPTEKLTSKQVAKILSKQKNIRLLAIEVETGAIDQTKRFQQHLMLDEPRQRLMTATYKEIEQFLDRFDSARTFVFAKGGTSIDYGFFVIIDKVRRASPKLN